MAKDDFTNNEILLMFREIKAHLDAQGGDLKEIKTQVVKTNGRVSILEMWKETFMARIATLIAVISVLWVGFKELILNK